jgi:hypothetical protein
VRYDLDPDRSSLTIHASSTLHPITTGAPVTGGIDVALDDQGQVDPAAPVDGELKCDLGGMRSGNALLDREARRRLDLRNHPTVTGRLARLSPAADGGHEGIGELDFHGVTAPLRGQLSVCVNADDELVLEGTTGFDVTDFAVQPPSLLLVKVHPEIRVELAAVAIRSSS